MAYRQPILLAPEDRQPPLRSPVAPRQPSPTPQIPQAPRLTPVHPASQVSDAPALTPGPLPSDWPPPLVIRKASQQPRVTREPSAAERDQQKIDQIFDAIGTDRLLVLMTGKYQDGPQITTIKIHVRTNAIRTSQPNNVVKNKGPKWVAIFHAVRKDLIDRAIELACLGTEEGNEQVEVTAIGYFEFGLLFQNVLQALCVVEKSIESEPAIQDEWVSAGKKDILDRVMEKYAAVNAAATAAERERESNSQSPSSGNEANMTIKAETSIQQISERLDSLDPTPQFYGVSTTITGPVTPAALNQNSGSYTSPPSYISALGEVLEAAENAGYMSDDTDSDESL